MKKIWTIAFLIVAVFTMAGCGRSTGESDRINIKFINGFTGGDGAYMKEITDGFNNSQDKFFIEELQEKDHYTKFRAGDYDLVVMHQSQMKTFKEDNLIQSVSAVMEKAGLSEADFEETSVEMTKIDEEMYGIPLDIHPMIAFYNKQLIDEAPTTYEEILNVNSELQAQDPNLFALGIPNAGLIEAYYFMIAAQNNINLEADGYMNFNQPEFAEALMKFHDMIWKDKVSPANLGVDGEFKAFMRDVEGEGNIQTAMAITGTWYYSAVSEHYGEDLGIAVVPQLGDVPAVSGNAHTISVPADVDEEVLEGIGEFLKYLFTTENLIKWAEAGQSPTHIPTMEYIQENQEKFPLAYKVQQQFSVFKPAPMVYQFGEQVRFMNEVVFNELVSTENLTKDALMQKLEEATQKAREIAEKAPE